MIMEKKRRKEEEQKRRIAEVKMRRRVEGQAADLRH